MSRNEPAVFDSKDSASPLSVTAARTALLLMDYHNVLISRVSRSGQQQVATALLKANSMRDWALANEALVVHCLVDFKQPVFPSFKSARRLKPMLETMDAQPEAADEHPDIAFRDGSGEHLVTRRLGYTSVLKSQNLLSLLSSRGIKSLILCGISTSGCVLSTARSAGDEEFIVTVIEDACMDPVAGLHDTLIEKVLPTQAHVATAMVFQEQWNKVEDGLTI